MKKLLLLTPVFVLCFGFIKNIQDEKKLKAEFTEREWDVRLQGIEYVKKKLEQSDLPAKEVRFMCDSVLSKFQNDLIVQLRPQVAAIKDTTKKK